jgi:hypothetical protein
MIETIQQALNGALFGSWGALVVLGAAVAVILSLSRLLRLGKL